MKLSMCVLIIIGGCGSDGAVGAVGPHDLGECPPPYTLSGVEYSFKDCEAACVSDKAVTPDEEQECTTNQGTRNGVVRYDGIAGVCDYAGAPVVTMTFLECVDEPIRYGCSPVPTISNNFDDGHVFLPSLDHLMVRAGVEKTFVLRGTGTAPHDHMITFTAADFAKLDKYEPVSVTSTVTNGHSHVVTVTCFGH